MDLKLRGFNFLGVLNSLSSPKITVGELYEKYKNVNPDDWYDADDFIEVTNLIEKKLGIINLKKIGEQISRSLTDNFENLGIKTPEDFIEQFVKLYDNSVQGNDKGKWEIIHKDIDKKIFILKKTTPFNCIMEEGILRGGLKYFDGVFPTVKQTVCVKKGDDHCEYEISY